MKEDTMFCQYCNNHIADGTQQCPYCGALIAPPTTPQVPQPAPGAWEQPPTQPEQSEQNVYGQEAPTLYGQPSPPPYEQSPTQPESPGRKKKRRTIIVAAASAVLVIALGIGGVMGFNAYTEHQRSTTYAEAASLMEQGNFAQAYEKFASLDDYEDSAAHAEYCELAVEFERAQELLENKEYSAARDAFFKLGDFMDAGDHVTVCDAWLAFEEAKSLTDQGLYEEAAVAAEGFGNVLSVRNDSDVTAWRNKNEYGRAELHLAQGQLYDAHQRFGSLGNYEDAAARAAACVQAAPGTGELYHNEGFYSSATDLVIEAGLATEPHYLKLYSGDALVSTVFVNPYSSATISIPAGSYTIKSASGAAWFGESDMFGDAGYYEVLLFDGGSESVHLDTNKIYTITLVYEGGGNVGGSSVNPENF